jgi:DNA ligase 1
MIRRRRLMGLMLLPLGHLGLPGTTLSQTRPPNASQPALMLSNVYRPGIRLAGYWLSEKYDGVRGYWDGEKLFTRGGEPITAPAWFTAGWPREPMDGELWAGRGQFARAVSTVRQQTPDDAAWQGIRFMVFDLPAHGGPFTERVIAYQQLLAQLALPWVEPVVQRRVASPAELQALLRQTVREGGEGLMLHRGDAPYRGLRSDDLLKVKTHDDAEARVVAHLPGQGRHAGRLGALLVETPGGLRFRLGTGLSDAVRTNPPAVGRQITYRYLGLNHTGVPRFASYLRIREDERP